VLMAANPTPSKVALFIPRSHFFVCRPGLSEGRCAKVPPAPRPQIAQYQGQEH